MTLEHLRAFLWLRWRLRVNQVRRAGALNAVLMAVAALGAVTAGVGGLVGGFAAGLLILPDVSPATRLYVWGGVVLGFLFSWMIRVLADLQRTESLSLDKFLQLPVSPAGAFVINYLSSFLSLTLVVFVPTMIGLAVGQVAGIGAASLLALPLVAAFVFAATAVTYQFQGWLASLMTNPRRRRTVVVFITAGFILLFQLPNFLNLAFQARRGGEIMREKEKWDDLTRASAAGEITPEERARRTAEIQREAQASWAGRPDGMAGQVEQTVRVVCLVLPPGWLALGAADLTTGAVVPALAGGLGLTLIGAGSLRRAYRTTLRLYRGEFTSGPGAGEARPAGPVGASPALSGAGARPLLVERVLPWVSEYASAVAAAGFRSLARAPEVKMFLLAPIVMAAVFGVAILSTPESPPEPYRPFIVLGVAMMLQLTSIQFIGNQFGLDRNGFRAFVLSPIPRREILLGKNLAVAPLALGPVAVLFVAAECVFPMRVDHLLGVVVQFVSVYLLTCLLANGLSIYAPIPLPIGSFRPARVKAGPVLLQMVFLFCYPFVIGPTFIPLAVEVLLGEFAGVKGWPVALVLSVGLLAGVVWLYRRLLTWEGRLLTDREQAILGVVTAKEE